MRSDICLIPSSKEKILGQVYTPEWIVEEILDLVGYKGDIILDRKVIDPACGDGAFLKAVVRKVIDRAVANKKSVEEIKQILENNIYGIEIDKEEYFKCLENLNDVVRDKLNIELDISWNVYNENSLLKYKDFVGMFDFVVGNPPYIRIHNLDKETRRLLKKEFLFSQGTIDIYVSFFELGFKLLNETGTLGYITPNSYLHNSSYVNFRRYLRSRKAVKFIIDFKSNKIFKNFSTYTAITVVNFSRRREFFVYKELIGGKIKEVNKIKYIDLNDKDWSFANKVDMEFIKDLYKNRNKKVSDLFDVQYGFATLRDKIFIGRIEKEKGDLVLFNNYWIERKLLHKVVKGSTYKGDVSEVKYIIFPYKRVGNRYVVIPEQELKILYPNTYNYLLENKEELLKRDIEKKALWYEFGRSQGIQTCHKEKIVVSTLMKNEVKYHFLDKDTFVYSGIFITKKEEEYDWKIIVDILSSDEFKRYIMITGKDFSGGYKSITSKQIKNFPVRGLEVPQLFNN